MGSFETAMNAFNSVSRLGDSIAKYSSTKNQIINQEYNQVNKTSDLLDKRDRSKNSFLISMAANKDLENVKNAFKSGQLDPESYKEALKSIFSKYAELEANAGNDALANKMAINFNELVKTQFLQDMKQKALDEIFSKYTSAINDGNISNQISDYEKEANAFKMIRQEFSDKLNQIKDPDVKIAYLDAFNTFESKVKGDDALYAINKQKFLSDLKAQEKAKAEFESKEKYKKYLSIAKSVATNALNMFKQGKPVESYLIDETIKECNGDKECIATVSKFALGEFKSGVNDENAKKINNITSMFNEPTDSDETTKNDVVIKSNTNNKNPLINKIKNAKPEDLVQILNKDDKYKDVATRMQELLKQKQEMQHWLNLRKPLVDAYGEDDTFVKANYPEEKVKLYQSKINEINNQLNLLTSKVKEDLLSNYSTTNKEPTGSNNQPKINIKKLKTAIDVLRNPNNILSLSTGINMSQGKKQQVILSSKNYLSKVMNQLGSLSPNEAKSVFENIEQQDPNIVNNEQYQSLKNTVLKLSGTKALKDKNTASFLIGLSYIDPKLYEYVDEKNGKAILNVTYTMKNPDGSSNNLFLKGLSEMYAKNKGLRTMLEDIEKDPNKVDDLYNYILSVANKDNNGIFFIDPNSGGQMKMVFTPGTYQKLARILARYKRKYYKK